MPQQFNDKNQMKEICDNFEMGLITEDEFKFQFINLLSGKTFQNFISDVIRECPIDKYFDFAAKLEVVHDEVKG